MRKSPFLIPTILLLCSSWIIPIDHTIEDSQSMTHIIMTISNIRSAEGKIQVGAFMDNESFDNETSNHAFHFSKDDLVDGSLTVEFDVPSGTFGFSLMDDENDNNKMDYNFFGIPKEGFGFGDYYHDGFSKPHFDKFKMTLAPDETKKVEVKFRYII